MRIVRLVHELKREPFSGQGKLEPLKHELSGFLSRHIKEEHGLVYDMPSDKTTALACRYHL